LAQLSKRAQTIVCNKKKTNFVKLSKFSLLLSLLELKQHLLVDIDAEFEVMDVVAVVVTVTAMVTVMVTVTVMMTVTAMVMVTVTVMVVGQTCLV
jgi:hypothetical protein